MTCGICGGKDIVSPRHNYNCKKEHDVCQDLTCKAEQCEGVWIEFENHLTHGVE